ncbi:CHASE2 domain-containing protein [Chitinophaga jiangningensis]|uniref:CHASE2 domain-containing protein n=2 Tax=Chitinophaga jiangningensis TaxID=1419482 RepID=A0A1M7LB44_9BACT|nr:CHASE2 domain-containing protein [Chitinophaga jiangningensis]
MSGKAFRFFGHLKLHVYTMLLIAVTFVWMALPYNNGLDMAVHKWTQLIKIAGPEKEKSSPDSVIFIDVSASKYLVPLNMDSTENEVITNRKYLAQLFQYIAAHQCRVRYILTDVVFDTPTPDDSALLVSIQALGNKLLAVNSYVADTLQQNILGVRAATATMRLQSGAIYKIPFTGSRGDTMVPLKIYLDVHPDGAVVHRFYTRFQQAGIAFNTQIPEMYLRAHDFTEGNYPKVSLGELVALMNISPELFDLYLKNRYILVGDFKNDLHETYLNTQPGTLILFNAFWQLESRRQIISVWYLLVLYLFIYVVVWLQWRRKSFIYNIALKPMYFQAFDLPFNIISVSLLLIVFTVLSALVFHVNISIFHLIVIFSLVDIWQLIAGKLDRKSSRWGIAIKVIER